ncbi:cell division protein FtsZ [Pelagicoccus mobilis]|uniref:Cell division protein FtsZ n=1 Tax=Pelagicoccus mobilis TaxID=415221 RepID=A0A934VQJ8_9BACT|nr:cell division protein FtsZ [Pelagicoccus mobilis]MBK1876574.1 cell division FtsZ family protein [Pelagicoccus mobilis]
MSDPLSDEQSEPTEIRMKVVGVGGAGSNIVDRLMLSQFSGVELVAVNTDQQALANSPIVNKLCIGKSVTGGLGSGGDVEVGREAALKHIDAIDEMVSGVDLLFIAAGLGGGTGTGAAPVIAEQALRQGALVIAFVALPFTIERSARANTALDGLRRLRDTCNAVVPLPNDLLIQESDPDASLLDAFAKADAWIEKAIRSIWCMMNKTGMINLDFAQLRQMLSKKAGKTLFGLGSGTGEGAAAAAVADLKLCPLLHTPEFSKKADQLLVNIVGGARIGIADTQMIMEAVSEEFGADANVTMGAVVDEDLGDSVEICILGTSEVSSVPFTKVVKQRAKKSKAEPKSEVTEEAKPAPKKSKPSRPVVHESSKPAEQEEFSFSEGDPKGEFENSSGTIFEGQDLDSPTYLRRGVKIVL